MKIRQYLTGCYRYNDGTSGYMAVREDDRDSLPPTMLHLRRVQAETASVAAEMAANATGCTHKRCNVFPPKGEQ